MRPKRSGCAEAARGSTRDGAAVTGRGRHGRRASRRLAMAALLAAVAVAAALPPAAGAEAPRVGEREYALIWEHNPGSFSNVLRAADDFLRGGERRQFRIVLDGYGIMVGVANTTTVQREYLDIRRRNPRLTVYGCKRVADLLRRANKGRRVPFLPGITIVPCEGLVEKLHKDGWVRAIGF